MYWVIHAIITAYESYVPINPIPFWAEVKAALYFSLLFDGPIQTTMVFNKVVKPYFLRYEKVLDKHLANLPEDAKKYMPKREGFRCGEERDDDDERTGG